MNKHYYLLRWLIPNSLLIFLAIGAWHYGFLFSLYSFDKSYISTLITIIYLVTSLYCLYRMYIISDQINLSNNIKNIFIKNSDSEIRHQSSFDIAACWLACGLDPKKAIFYRQSDIPYIFELAWFLSCLSSKGLLNRAVTESI